MTYLPTILTSEYLKARNILDLIRPSNVLRSSMVSMLSHCLIVSRSLGLKVFNSHKFFNGLIDLKVFSGLKVFNALKK